MIAYNQIKIEKSSQNITSDGGLILLHKVFDKLDINTLFSSITFEDNRSLPVYSNEVILMNKLSNLFLGYNSQTLQAKSSEDALFRLGGDIPSQPTISRMYKRITLDTLFQLEQANIALIKPIIDKLDVVVLDIDSTGIKCHGEQEDSNHNYHYNHHGYHPLMITEDTTGLVMLGKLRPGNMHCANGLETMIDFLYDNFNLEKQKVMIRADSQFSKNSKLFSYDSYELDYAIKMMRQNKKLGKLIEDETMDIAKNRSTNNLDPIYGQMKWEDKSYGTKVISFKGEVKYDETGQRMLFDQYQIIVSNIDDTPENIFEFYNQRGASENIFRELKNDFAIDKLSHTSFIENEFDFLFSLVAYNIYKIMVKKIAPNLRSMMLCTFCRDYLKFAAKVITHARQNFLKVDNSFRRFDAFMKMFESI